MHAGAVPRGSLDGSAHCAICSSKGQVFTGKRVVHPQPDWWYVGGRMMPGESPARSCARLIKRELGLVIAPERFTPITYNSLVWDMREQEVLSICATARRLALEP